MGNHLYIFLKDFINAAARTCAYDNGMIRNLIWSKNNSDSYPSFSSKAEHYINTNLNIDRSNVLIHQRAID